MPRSLLLLLDLHLLRVVHVSCADLLRLGHGAWHQRPVAQVTSGVPLCGCRHGFDPDGARLTWLTPRIFPLLMLDVLFPLRLLWLGSQWGEHSVTEQAKILSGLC